MLASIKAGTPISVVNLRWLTKQLQITVHRQDGKQRKPLLADYVHAVKNWIAKQVSQPEKKRQKISADTTGGRDGARGKADSKEEGEEEIEEEEEEEEGEEEIEEEEKEGEEEEALPMGRK